MIDGIGVHRSVLHCVLRRAADTSTNRRQGFLCRRTASTEHAANRAEAAAVDHDFSSPTAATVCSSLPMDTGKQTDDCFVMRCRWSQLRQFLQLVTRMLRVAVAQSSSGGVAICHVLPVLLTTPHFRTNSLRRCRRRSPRCTVAVVLTCLRDTANVRIYRGTVGSVAGCGDSHLPVVSRYGGGDG